MLIGQDFDRNIRTDLRTVTAASAAELDGLPADYIARHKPDADGTITLTIDYPDSLPVFSYAKNEDLRKRMYMEYNNRAYPKNIEVLDKMIARRAELARLLGFSSWADYITADKMVGSAAQRVRVHRSHRRGVGAEGRSASTTRCSSASSRTCPGATAVNAWERTYYAELVRKAQLRLRLAVGPSVLRRSIASSRACST